MAGCRGHEPVLGVRRHEGAGPTVRRLSDVEQSPAVHGAAGIERGEQLVVKLAHGQRDAVSSGLEGAVVDAKFRGEKWLRPDGFFHRAHTHVEAVGIVEEILIVVDVGGSVIDAFHDASVPWNASAAATPSARVGGLCMWIFTSRKPASSNAWRSETAICCQISGGCLTDRKSTRLNSSHFG